MYCNENIRNHDVQNKAHLRKLSRITNLYKTVLGLENGPIYSFWYGGYGLLLQLFWLILLCIYYLLHTVSVLNKTHKTYIFSNSQTCPMCSNIPSIWLGLHLSSYIFSKIVLLPNIHIIIRVENFAFQTWSFFSTAKKKYFMEMVIFSILKKLKLLIN
jgi:hypothetical protein